MSVTIIPNQPLKLLESGEANHNDQVTLCNCRGQKFWQKVQCDDISSVQVTLEEATGLELLTDGGFDNPLVDDTTDGTNGDNIVDSGGDFIDDGILDDMLATNDTDTTYSYVDTGVAPGVTAIELGITTITGGFVTGEDYRVWRWRRKTGGSFGAWTGAEYMNIDNDILTKVGDANDVAVFDTFDAETGVYYKVQFTIQNVARTTSDGGVKIYLGGVEAIFVPESGQYTFYFLLAAPTDDQVVVQGVDCTFEMTTISLKKMTRLTIGAKNVATGNLDFIDEDASNISYNPIQVDDDNFSIENDPLARAVFNWADLVVNYQCPEGCYELCLLDLPTNNLITNGEFIGNGGWSIVVVVTNPWTIAAGVLIVDGPGNTTANLNILVNTLIGRLEGLQSGTGKKYTLTLTVSNWLSGGLFYNLPNNNTTALIFDGSANANGDHIIEIDLTGEAFDETVIRFFATGNDWGNGFSDFTVDNIAIYEKAESVSILNCSEPFYLKSSHVCTKLLKWTNDSDAFGMSYGQFSIVHSLRVDAKLYQAIWDKPDKSTDIDSIGNAANIYSRTIKKPKLIIREVPEYLHEALAISVEHDTFLVDDEVFINQEDEYSPVWRKSSLLAPVTLELVKSGDLLEKRRC